MPTLYQGQLRYARHYLRLLQAAEGFERGLFVFEHEAPHILGALTQIGRQAEHDDEAARLYQQMFLASDTFLSLRQPPRAQIPWLEMGVTAARRLRQAAVEGFYLNRLGTARFASGDYPQAIAEGEQANEAGFDLQGLGDDTLLLALGSDPYLQVSGVVGEIERKEAFYKLFDLLHRKLGVAGDALQPLKDGTARQAIELAAAALQRFEQNGDAAGAANARANLAAGYAAEGDYPAAISHYLQALENFRALNNAHHQALTLYQLGWLYAALNDLPRSLELLTQTLDTCRASQDRRGECLTLGGLGAVHALNEAPGPASAFYEQALAITRELPDAMLERLLLDHLKLARGASGV